MKRVFIVWSSFAYAQMFERAGWEVVRNIENADLVQFTGGADVTPSYYGEERHQFTHNDPHRDDFERRIFYQAKALGKKMAGICRGGQFLNVMSGGRMWQHVDNHAIGHTHPAKDIETGEEFEVTSTHHQMMRPSPDAQVVATAALCTRRESYNEVNENMEDDIEVVYYPQSNALCFQPHPEFNVPSCRKYYFQLLERFFGL